MNRRSSSQQYVYFDGSMIPTAVPVQRLSRSSRSFAINSAFCSRVVSYRLAFIATAITLPIKGRCLTQDSCHRGGVAASAVSLFCVVFVGMLRSEDSATIFIGQSIDHSTVLGGRDFKSSKFLPCSRNIGMLHPVSTREPPECTNLGQPRRLSRGFNDI